MKRTVSIILFLFLFIAIFPAQAQEGVETAEIVSQVKKTADYASGKSAKKPKSLTINGSKYVVKDKKITLSVTVTPAKASKDVFWKSSNPDIAKVDENGVVKGLKAGKVKITATSVSNEKISSTFEINVMGNAVSKVTIKGETDTLNISGTKTITLTANAKPETAAQSFEWMSSNNKVATVSEEGVVTAVGVGNAKITATATDGSRKKATYKIKVKEDLTIEDGDFLFRYEAERKTMVLIGLSAAGHEKTGHLALPAKTNGKTVKEVAENALAGGKATSFTIPKSIELVGKQDFHQTISYLWIKGDGTKLDGLKKVRYVIGPKKSKAAEQEKELKFNFIDSASIKSHEGLLYQIGDEGAALICPEDDSTVAAEVVIPKKVSGYLIREVKEGAFETCQEQITRVLVSESVNIPKEGTDLGKFVTKVPIQSISISDVPDYLVLGESLQLSSVIVPEEATQKELEWRCNAPEIMTVDEHGFVTAVSVGKATVFAYATDGSEKVGSKVFNVAKERKGLVFIDNTYYYFDENGDPISGFTTIDGRLYHFDENGKGTNGWIFADDDIFYAKDGALATGFTFVYISHAGRRTGTYYFNPQGRMLTGFQTIDGERYHFDADGRGSVGWFDDENGRYLTIGVWYSTGETGFYLDGKLAIGRITLEDGGEDDGTYYFDENGVMQTGFVKYKESENGEGLYHYHDEEGKRQNELKVGEDIYYFDSNGMAPGLITVYGTYTRNLYYINEQGHVQTGFVAIDGKLYYFDSDGKASQGWIKDETGIYYAVNGVLHTGLQMIWENGKGETYLFDGQGRLQTGFVTVDGKLYHSDSEGKVSQGWIKDETGTYYAVNGVLHIGLQMIMENGKGDTYFFDEQGRMQTGFVTIDGKLYHFDSEGKASQGWIKEETGTYYALPPHGLLQTGLQMIVENGKGETYFFDEQGRMQTGSVTIDGKLRHFDSEGKEVQD